MLGTSQKMIEKQPRHRAAVTQLGMSAVSLKVSQRGFIPIREVARPRDAPAVTRRRARRTITMPP